MKNTIDLATVFAHPETLEGHDSFDKVLVSMTWYDLRKIRELMERERGRIKNGTKDADSGQGEET